MKLVTMPEMAWVNDGVKVIGSWYPPDGYWWCPMWQDIPDDSDPDAVAGYLYECLEVIPDVR